MDIVVYILVGVLVVAMLAVFYYYDKAGHYKFWLNKYRQWNKESLTDNAKKHYLIKAQKEYIELLNDERIELLAVYERWYGEPYKTMSTELSNTIKELE